MSLSPPTKPVYLKACGAATSVGLTAEFTASAVRGGVSAFEESSIYNKRFNPMTLALIEEEFLPPLDDAIAEEAPELTSRQIRMIKLAHIALDDLASKFDKLDGLPLMLAGPETLPEMSQACHADFIKQIEMQTGIAFHKEHSVLLNTGRTGGITALQYAMAYLEAGMSDYAIIGGVDTYLDLYLLATLDMEDRVLASGVMDGFAPGEGAGFFIIGSKAESFEKTDQNIRLFPPGLSSEPGHRYSEETYMGDGLAESFTLAIENANLPQIKTVLASLNGENLGGKELGVAATRNSDQLGTDYAVFHPADCFGDIGAAFFPVSVALSAYGFLKDYVESPVIHYASSEMEARGAVCVFKA